MRRGQHQAPHSRTSKDDKKFVAGRGHEKIHFSKNGLNNDINGKMKRFGKIGRK